MSIKSKDEVGEFGDGAALVLEREGAEERCGVLVLEGREKVRRFDVVNEDHSFFAALLSITR